MNEEYLPQDLDGMLTQIEEEAAEVIQAVTKIRRFGFDAHHPDRPHRNNIDDLLRECKDFKHAYTRFFEHYWSDKAKQ